MVFNTQFTYNAFGNLASAQYADGSYDYKLPDEVGNLYKNKEKNKRKYAKGGQLKQDKNWHYLYDEQGNLIKKSKNNTQQVLAEFKKEAQKNTQPQKKYWIDRIFGYTNEPEKPDLDPKTPTTHWQYGEWFYTWQANGMLKSVKDPKGKVTVFEYDALGRRTTKINLAKKEINRYIYDGNVLLHEFSYDVAERPKTVADDLGRISLDRDENTENLTTWVFEEGSFVPQAKITNEGTFSIISDYLGTPILSFDEKGNKVWERELDIYGKVKKGDSSFVPFLYQGQYYDEETELAYNRFRYYSPDSGTYISQDPIGLAGGMPNMYAYVWDSNSQFDPFGQKIWSYSNMPKIDGMELHHVIPKSLLKDHKILKAIGYDVNKVNNLIYLPKEFGGYGSRSAHKGWAGDHSKYNKMMRQELDDILEAATEGNWSKQKISDAVEDLRTNTRQGLRSGKIKCR